MMGRLQLWLQGHPNKRRPWPAIWLGNRISDGRYWLWRLSGGQRRLERRTSTGRAVVFTGPFTASNIGTYYEISAAAQSGEETA